jgi:hypothetical protein
MATAKKATTPATRKIEGEGYTGTITGSQVQITFNMDKVLKLSSSGKSNLSCSSGGFIPLANGRKMNLTATIPLSG